MNVVNYVLFLLSAFDNTYITIYKFYLSIIFMFSLNAYLLCWNTFWGHKYLLLNLFKNNINWISISQLKQPKHENHSP